MARHSPGLREAPLHCSCSSWEEAGCRRVWPCARNGWSKDGWAPGSACRGPFTPTTFPKWLAELGRFSSLIPF